MKNVIVGTAGHIDHGKTCLIKALTNVETDRLKEEKKRGITIELGFADLPNNRGLDIGIIDVPGHEKFVRHMLAGIGGIDLVLLVVAADEGFMPQTTEHFEILKMLQIKRGIVVLTKVDMVDSEWLQMVIEDIKEEVKGTFLEGAPVACVSSHTGENIEVLKEQLLQMAEECKKRREDPQLLRLPIDRVFTIDGFGTVITGTLMEGSVHQGNEVLIYPSQKKAKIRNIQVHGCPAVSAVAGQRTAINLAGIKKEELTRGSVVAAPGLMENTRRIDVRIELFPSAKRTLKNNSRLHFYYGSAEALCKAVLLNEEDLSRGQWAYVQLRFEKDIALKREDRFIVRFYSPMETIGGGRVLNAAARRKKRFDPRAVKSLEILDFGSEKEVLEQIFLEESQTLSGLSQVLKRYAKTKEEAAPFLNELLQEQRLKKIDEDLVLHQDYIADLEKKTRLLLEAYHRVHPVIGGMLKEEFRGKLCNALHGAEMKKIEGLMGHLSEAGIVKEKAGRIALADFSVTYTEEQQELADKIEARYLKAWLEPPDLDSVLAEKKNKESGQQLLESLCDNNLLKKLNYQYYIHSQALKEALELLTRSIEKNGRITLAEYRDLIGTSRKYAIMLLEYADAKQITERTGEYRMLVR